MHQTIKEMILFRLLQSEALLILNVISKTRREGWMYRADKLGSHRETEGVMKNEEWQALPEGWRQLITEVEGKTVLRDQLFSRT